MGGDDNKMISNQEESMEIQNITVEDLRRMEDKEGLILQGCGGEPGEWVQGINDLLTQDGILLEGTAFTHVSVFQNEGLTCLLFPFEDVKLDIGKLAMWRLQTHDTFGGTWLSDYIDNHLGREPAQEVPEKPDCPLIGQDGNIFNLVGIASRTLKAHGMTDQAKEMADLIYKVKGEGDTIGGTLTCVIKGCPIGLGQPVFGKLHAALGNAMLSINAAKAFEYGEGFKGLKMKGSEQNDVFYNNNGRIETHTNHSGGIQGGLSNGQDIYFRVVFKPIATLLMEQETVNIDGIDTTLKARGRHDACVLPRAVPIVEAMAAMTILDYYLLDKATQL